MLRPVQTNCLSGWENMTSLKFPEEYNLVRRKPFVFQTMNYRESSEFSENAVAWSVCECVSGGPTAFCS